MAVFKCKMCGGDLEIIPGSTTAECLHCGSQQTLPKLGDDVTTRLYDRANHFRRNNEFDKAMGIYEQILNEDPTDAESYWSIVLCKYGIEYVEDPVSHKRIPTVNRTQFTSIFDDDNYASALKHADMAQRLLYEKEAQAINEIQKNILKISQQEEPFDVFICYKETDERGQRTRDSVYANDLYHQLTQEGFKVFFARITLEDKLGSAYEPYIFAALNSAKIMVVIGTKPEYFNAVWVKNEWSRYLSLIKGGAQKTLIPAYSGMDPYDLPQEFSHLQAQDMSKLGFMPDLIRGIKKIIGVEEHRVEEHDYHRGGPGVRHDRERGDTDVLLRRVAIFMDNQDWSSADLYCEKVLDIDPENGSAYLYKLLARVSVSSIEKLEKYPKPLDTLPEYKNAVRFSDEKTSEQLTSVNRIIRQRLQREEEERQELARQKADREQRERERRQRMSELETARRNASQHIDNMLREKDNLEQQLASKRLQSQNLGSHNKKLRTRAILALIFLFLFIVVGSTSTSSGDDLAIVFCILYAIFAVRLHKARGKSAAVIILDFFTLFLYTLICAISTLIKCRKTTMASLTQDIQSLSSRIGQIDEQVDQTRASIRELNNKMENLA